MNRKFWKGKRVLITGHEGFLGSNLTKTLLNVGAIITGIDLDVRRKNTLFTDDDYCRFRTIKGSVTDDKLIKKVLKEFKPKVVFHLAAEAIVSKCHNDPLCAFSTNIEGTWKLLEAARNNGGGEAIIVASSDKAYGSHKKLPYREDAPLIGANPYDVSKSCADLIAYSYYHAYKLPIAVTRCGNIYGPGDFNFSRIVPDAVRCAVLGKCLPIRSDGKFTRDYVYVDDIVSGYIMLAEQMKKKNLSGEAFNFSDENPITVLKFIEEIYRIAGKKPDYAILNTARYEIQHQYLSSKKAREILGWKARFSMDKGIRKTIDWYTARLLKKPTFGELWI